jgi:hypothetical protein
MCSDHCVFENKYFCDCRISASNDGIFFHLIEL